MNVLSTFRCSPGNLNIILGHHHAFPFDLASSSSKQIEINFSTSNMHGTDIGLMNGTASKCQMIPVTLERDLITYDALSCVWGKPKQTYSIKKTPDMLTLLVKLASQIRLVFDELSSNHITVKVDAVSAITEEQLGERGLSSHRIEEFDAFGAVLQLPWFLRAWVVVQEMDLSSWP